MKSDLLEYSISVCPSNNRIQFLLSESEVINCYICKLCACKETFLPPREGQTAIYKYKMTNSCGSIN